MMKRVAWVLFVVLFVGGVYAMAYRSVQPVGTPAGQIRAAILDAVDALQNGRAGQAMAVVSPEYKDSTGNNRDRLYFLARQAAQNRGYWNGVVEELSPEVSGDTARVHLVIAIHRTEGGGLTRHNVTLVMHREPTHAYLVIPTNRWRIVSAEGLPSEDNAFGD